MGAEQAESGVTAVEDGPTGEVVCLGETMMLFVSSARQAPHRDAEWRSTVAGAESNVARHLAVAGRSVRWVGAVGDDPFGRSVLDHLAETGVDVTDVRVDGRYPTGLYFKDAASTRSGVWYHRSGSAAAAMSPELLDELDLSRVSLLHLTGITAALSPSCRELLEVLLARPRGNTLVSLDVNWRPQLWRAPGAESVSDPAALLRELADSADVVLVGDDEAAAVWDTGSTAGIREVLPNPETLLVKHGARGATLIERECELFEPALGVDVVDPVGAGDAFAAGFLAARLDGHDGHRCLRAGHLQAAAVLCGPDDVGSPLPDADVSRMLAADANQWVSARVREGRIDG